MPLLEIRNLHARVAAAGGKDILKGVNLTIDIGEVHAIMGKNGSGKSTLVQVLMGREAYAVTAGEVHYKGKDLFELLTEERRAKGSSWRFSIRWRSRASARTIFSRRP